VQLNTPTTPTIWLYAGLLILLLALILLAGWNGWIAAAGASQTSPALLTTWTFQGRVYEGNVGQEPPNAQAIQGVTVSVYGANSAYPNPGTFIRSTTTDSTGWYGLSVYDDDGPWEYYHLRETDPPGYTSAGATSVDGTVRDANWIEYTAPLTGKTLTGNKFWDRRPATSTPTPTATYTATPAPTLTATRTVTPIPIATATPTATTSPSPPTPTPTPTGLPPGPTATPTATGTPSRITPTPTATETAQPVLSGRVYAGEIGDETRPLSGVFVNLHCSQNQGEPGTLLRSTTTNAEGWYRLNAGETCEFYNILEFDPPGYLPVGATSVGGVVRDPNWIQYVYPLTGKVLTDNKFWDRVAGTPGPTATSTSGASPTPTPSPTRSDDLIRRTFSGQVFRREPGGALVPWPGIVVGLFKASISCEEGLLVVQIAADELGRFTLDYVTPARDDAPYYNLILPDEMIKVVGARSESGGYFTDQGWLQFANPSAGLHGYNDLFAKDITNERRLLPAADADAYVSVQASDYNFGTLSDLRTGYSAGPDTIRNRTFAYFDLDYIPITATVTKATLNLYLEQAGGASKVCLLVYQSQQSWTETGITWDNQPTQLDLSAAHIVDTSLGYKSWDITSLVQDWINSPQTNYGLALVGPESGSGWSRAFSSREGSHAPRLVIYVQSSVPFATPTPTNTPTLTPTPTPTGTPVTRQVQITAVEINQAIQDLNNTVPLVAGKKTVVRVHLKVTDGKGDLPGVSGYLYYPYTGYGPVFSPQSTITARANPDRGTFNHTLNFVVDSQYATGSGLMFVRVFPPSGVTFPGIGELQDSRVISFGTVPAMNLRLVGVSYVTNTVTYTPRNIDYANTESWLRRVYPIGTLNSSRTTTSVSYAASKPGPDCGDVNTALAQIKAQDIANNTSTTDTRYHGLVFQGPPTYYFMRGCCCTSGASSGPTGAATWGWDNDGSYGDWYAGHEIGHGYGLCHPGFCRNQAADTSSHCSTYPYPNGYIGGTASNPKQFYGMDVENLQVIAPTWTDLMSYCDNLWISDFNYKRLRNQMINPLSAASDERRERLMVIGSVNLATDAVTLASFQRMPNAPDAVEREPGEYIIVLANQQGGRLAEYPFTPRVQTVEQTSSEASCVSAAATSADNPPATIFEFVPWVAETARISIYHGERELAGRNVSPNPPTVQLLSPNGGEMVAGDFFPVTWNAHDPDGDPLTFSLLYSRDGGESWTTLVAGLTGTRHDLDARLLPGSPQGRMRVIASDGVNTASDQSDTPFIVLPRPPQVSILSPGPDSFINSDEVVALTGDAYDPEQGALTGSALTWESDRDGPLGSGATLILSASSLTPGPHRLILRATDGDGMTGIASVNIIVGRRLYLPLSMRSYAGEW